MHYFDINVNIKININTSNTNNTSCCCSCNICSISWQLLPKIAHPNLFLPRDCASPSRTFKGVQPHAATSLASRRLDLDLWTLRRDVFLAPSPCTRRKRSPYEFIISFQFPAFSVSFGPFFEPSALTFRPAPPPGPANAWGSVVGAADRRGRPPLMYPGDEARSAPRRLSSPVEVGCLSHH